MRHTLTIVTTFLLAPPGSLHAADFILADKARGIAHPPIIVFRRAAAHAGCGGDVGRVHREDSAERGPK